MKDSPAERAARLRELINDYRYNYHVLNKSIMSEAAADSLKHELTKIEEAHPELITPDSPTQRVAGEPLPQFKKVQHSGRMLSLNDVFSEEEFNAWVKRITKLAAQDEIEFFMDLKMDGLACALVYKDGVLVQGITRGDGFVGEDVTANIRTIDSVPLLLRKAKGYEKFLIGRTEIRGEIVMYKDQFEKLNAQREKQDLPKFANPRNLAAGNYVARSFNLNGNSTLTVSGGIVQIWVTGSLSIGGKANSGGVPENLEFFLTSASGANINGGSTVSALVYGPTTPVIVSAPVKGSVIGSRTTLNSGGQVTFDPNSTCPTGL